MPLTVVPSSTLYAMKRLLLLVAAIAFLAFSPLAAQRVQQTDLVPREVRFGGKLNSADGTPRTGQVLLKFSLYDKQESLTPVWSETQTVTLDAAGHYSVLLGSASAGLPVDVFASGDAKWLGVAEEGGQESPRVSLISVPYALKASDSETLGGHPASDYQLVTSTGTSSAARKEQTAAVNTTTGSTNSIPVFTDNNGT